MKITPVKTSPFPLGVCLATAITAGLALSASALNVQWGADPAFGDALRLAWPYVNLAMVAILFLLWPAMRLTAGQAWPRPIKTLAWDLPAIALAATPAFALAAWLCSVELLPLLRMLALHASFAIFTLGLLRHRGNTAPRQTLLATLGVVLVLILPLLAYLELEFLGRSSAMWSFASPPLAILSASTSVWWTAAIYALLGALLLGLPPGSLSKES